MTDSWTWTYQDANGAPMTPGGSTIAPFPTQSDAESWLGESWHELADAGVETVTLLHENEVVYGPMSLRAAE
ncbi:MAG TPA: hypothetical protein VFL99_08490 [Segeticoccus sp.]|uniref:hypothetical protein n=1 Tax=Segeticoccus sp. TaxID=2706531 RepID=UPI002D806DFC|nr:hypothetical protein [Segeticoccus sp.]HET8600350.1 hypothetical protein [Segeticoccus sp.]